MRVRGVIKRRKGSPVTTVRATVPTSPACDDCGVPHVLAHVRAHDEYDHPAVLATLTLTVAEARELGRRLIDGADAAERLSALEKGGAS